MEKINLFNALDTLRNMANESREMLEKIDEIEKEINFIKQEKSISEFSDMMDLLKKQEAAKDEIMAYIIECGSEVIIPIEIWNNWKPIISGFFSIEEKRYYTGRPDRTKADVNYYKHSKKIVAYLK